MRTFILAIAATLLFACSSSDTVKEGKKLRDRMCACKDMTCGAKVQKDHVVWLAQKGQKAGKREQVELAPVMLKYKECLDGLMKKTKKDVTKTK